MKLFFATRTAATPHQVGRQVMRRSVVLSAVVASLAVAPTVAESSSSAIASEDPCALAFNLFCEFVPVAPDLEGDIDLTEQMPVVEGDSSLSPSES